MNRMDKSSAQFYSPLLRLIAKFRGGDTRPVESNGSEARLIGLAIYAVHYVFFAAKLIPLHLAEWLIALLLVALAFWIWLFWLLVLYLNSVIIKLLRRCGFFRTIPDRRLQSILWGVITTAMALELLRCSPWMRELGSIWLLAVGMNLVSALILSFSDATRSPGT
jgi:hypothetical protein